MATRTRRLGLRRISEASASASASAMPPPPPRAPPAPEGRPTAPELPKPRLLPVVVVVAAIPNSSSNTPPTRAPAPRHVERGDRVRATRPSRSGVPQRRWRRAACGKVLAARRRSRRHWRTRARRRAAPEAGSIRAHVAAPEVAWSRSRASTSSAAVPASRTASGAAAGGWSTGFSGAQRGATLRGARAQRRRRGGLRRVHCVRHSITESTAIAFGCPLDANAHRGSGDRRGVRRRCRATTPTESARWSRRGLRARRPTADMRDSMLRDDAGDAAAGGATRRARTASARTGARPLVGARRFRAGIESFTLARNLHVRRTC